MKKIHLLPNLITALGLYCGLFVLFKVVLYPQKVLDSETLKILVAFLICGAAADLFDGAVARLLKAQSDFGVQFDSFSDVITFGISPVAMVLKTIDFDGDLVFFVMAASMVYTLCGVLRLIRYTINALDNSDKNESIFNDKKLFIGLPITAAAPGIISICTLLSEEKYEFVRLLSKDVRIYIYVFSMLVLGYFMISKWKFPSLKVLNFKVKSFNFAFISVSSAILLIYGISKHFSLVLFSISWGYILFAWTLSIARIVAGRRSNTLVDFEPEGDDF